MTASYGCWTLTLPLALTLAGETARAATFTNVTKGAGIDYNQYASIAPNLTEAYYMTGGAAAGDYDGDGWVDLYVTRFDAEDILYRNRHDGTFEAISPESIGIARTFGSNGPAWADIDNDGDLDLYITTLSRNRNYLYINNGNGTFSDVTNLRGAKLESDGSFSQANRFSAAFGDYDKDGFLDLFTTSWGDLGGVGTALLKNAGASNPGFFVNVTDKAGVAMGQLTSSHGSTNRSFAFAPRFSDLDGDGFPDLAVASDFRTSRLFWNNGDGTFRDGTLAAGAGTDENGMGSAIGDYDGDGLLDWFVTSIYDPAKTFEGSGNRLYKNQGARIFKDVTDAAGVRDGGWGWGAAFFDYDNDGDLDIIMTNGIRFPLTSVDDKFNFDRMRLWRNDGNGVFTEVGEQEGITDLDSGKGLLVFDYDNDGDLDVFVVNNAGTPVLYRNDLHNGNSWLKVQTEGVVSNRQGIGARVTVVGDLNDPEHTTQLREISAGSNFLGQDPSTAHFGLGSRNTPIPKLVIQWPSGIEQIFTNVPLNTTLRAVELDANQCSGNSYKDWTCRYFSPAEQGREEISGQSADADGDGLPNLLEYAMGLNPRRRDAEFGTALSKNGTNRFVVITYPESKLATNASIALYRTFSARSAEAGTLVTPSSRTILRETAAVRIVQASIPIGTERQAYFRFAAYPVPQ